MKTYRVRLSKKQMEAILVAWARPTPAMVAAKELCISRRTVTLWYTYIRQAIADASKPPRFSGEVEIDQYEHGARKYKEYSEVDGNMVEVLKQKKVMLIAIVQRGEKSQVYVQIIKRMDRRTTDGVIHMVVEGKSRVFTDGWRSFNKLREDGYEHYVVIHRREFAIKVPRKRLPEVGQRTVTIGDEIINVHTQNVDRFFAHCDTILAQKSGVPRNTIHLHIKECEFRWNNRGNVLEAIKALLLHHNPRRRNNRKPPKKAHNPRISHPPQKS